MKKLKADEEKSDGLEITSVGSLYAGPWDKKYWSSSRGKDRYPYPVGYQAVRAYDENTYKMEIHEGPKGPLFMITSADGHTSSGQTPGIAWSKFQKKYCPSIKIWHGNRKRFSCNIDGVEFFGFKNPLVQRLLREMVANGGSAEQDLLSSNLCKETPKTDNISHHPDPCNSHELLPNMERPKVTGKRSRKHEIMNSVSSTKADPKRSKPQDLLYVTEAPHPTKEDQRSHGIGNIMPSLEEDCDNCEKQSALPPSLDLIPGQEEKHHIAENDFPLDYVDNKQRITVSAAETTVPIDSQHFSATGLAGNLPTEEKPLDRLQVTEVENCAFLMEREVKDGERTGPGDCQALNDVELYAPDTLDVEEVVIPDSDPSDHDKVNNKLKEVTPADMISSEGSIRGSNPDEEEIGASNSNAGSEKSDFDSVGHDMMTFLLPQAIPLLKKTSRKKKVAVSPMEVLPCLETKENNPSSPAVGLTEKKMSDMKEHMNIESTNIGSADGGSFVVLNPAVDQIFRDSSSEILPSGEAKSDQITCGAETRLCNKCGQCTGNGEHSDSLDCYLEMHGSKDLFCCDYVHTESSVMLPMGSVVPESEIRDASMSVVENSEVGGAESTNDVQLQGMLSSSGVQLKEPGTQTAAEEAGNGPFSQVPSLVYTRRKKVQTKNQKRKYTGPLSESIICRSFVDGSTTETCEMNNNLISLETLQMGSASYDDKPHKKDLSSAHHKAKSLSADRPTTDLETPQNDVVPAVSQDNFFKCASKDTETADFLDKPGSHLQNSNINVDKVVVHENLLVPSCSESSQKQGKSLSSDSNVAKEFQRGSAFMPKGIETKKDMLGIFETVGCYLHPLPVLSLTVSTGGEGIHICVVCGLQVGNERTLFIYKIATREPTVGHPSFIGHTSVTFPIIKDYFDREISVERSGLQFTPEGQHLVLLDSIRTPHCRQGRIPCLCSACASESFEGDAVKIVKVKSGYVSTVAKLKASESLKCVLICQPNYLVSVGESGRLHLWVMNSTWSAHEEKFVMPSVDLISPGMVDLKRIPKCDSLVVGHNGFGEFSLWDISKQILVSKFSGSSNSCFDFFPVGLFRWKKNDYSFGKNNVDGHVNRMMAATNMWYSEQTKDDGSFLPLEEDIAVWLLVSVVSDSDAQHDYKSRDCETKSAGLWRLALLAKNMVIPGSALDPSSTAVSTSAGHGIFGTRDGLVYIWEMSTGAKLGTLHHFRGSNVSCIATDSSKEGVVAIAGSDGKLLVYVPSQKNKGL